jgi:hypothetical protein
VVRAYAWVIDALFTYPYGEALPRLHSRPPVIGVAARLSGRLEEQRRILAHAANARSANSGKPWWTRSACNSTARARPVLIVPASGVGCRTQWNPRDPCQACTSSARSCGSPPTLAAVYPQSPRDPLAAGGPLAPLGRYRQQWHHLGSKGHGARDDSGGQTGATEIGKATQDAVSVSGSGWIGSPRRKVHPALAFPRASRESPIGSTPNQPS